VSASGSQPQSRPERANGRARRVGAGIGGAVLLLANATRLHMPLWQVATLIASVLLVALAWQHVMIGNLRDLTTPEELGDAVDSAKGSRRVHLVWYEYVIARNVVRGTYAGEPPSDFKSDVYDVSTSLGMTTRRAFRQVLWMLGIFGAVSICVPLFISAGDTVFALIVFGALAAITLFSGTVTLLMMWWASRSPRAAIGRRIEAAIELSRPARWEALTEIAREELESASAA